LQQKSGFHYGKDILVDADTPAVQADQSFDAHCFPEDTSLLVQGCL